MGSLGDPFARGFGEIAQSRRGRAEVMRVVCNKRRWGSERGASLVEFALILPVFAMLILGMVTGGNAYFEKITITDSVREGARYGATLQATLGPAGAAAWENAVKERVAEVSGGELTADDVCAELVPASDPDPTGCPVTTPAGATDYVVKVSASKQAKMEWVVGATDLTLTGKSVARYERTPNPAP